MCVEPLEPSKFMHFVFEFSVFCDEVIGLRETRAPDADTDEKLF